MTQFPIEVSSHTSKQCHAQPWLLVKDYCKKMFTKQPTPLLSPNWRQALTSLGSQQRELAPPHVHHSSCSIPGFAGGICSSSNISRLGIVENICDLLQQ